MKTRNQSRRRRGGCYRFFLFRKTGHVFGSAKTSKRSVEGASGLGRWWQPLRLGLWLCDDNRIGEIIRSLLSGEKGRYPQRYSASLVSTMASLMKRAVLNWRHYVKIAYNFQTPLIVGIHHTNFLQKSGKKLQYVTNSWLKSRKTKLNCSIRTL